MSANQKYRTELSHWNHHYRPVTFDVEAYMRDTLRKLIPKPDFVVERERLEAEAAAREELDMQEHSNEERESNILASAILEGCSRNLEPLTSSSETTELDQWTTGVASESLWDDRYEGQLKVIIRLPPPDASEFLEETSSWSNADSLSTSSQASSWKSDNPWYRPINPRFSFFAFDFNPRCKLIPINFSKG